MGDDTPARMHTIHGIVTGAQGQPLDGAEIIVWWQRIRDRRRLETGETSEHGKYHIAYRVPEVAPAKLLIVIEAHSSELERPIQSAALASLPDQTVNLAAAPHDGSLYTTIDRAVHPLLEHLSLHDIVENDQHHDISFLSTETGRTKEELVRVAISARLEQAYDIPAAAFFAFLRLQVPSSLPTPLLDATENFTLIGGLVQRIASLIFALSADLQNSTLQGAIKENIIGRQFAREVPALVAAFQNHRTSNLLSQPYIVGKASLGDLLSVAAIPQEKQIAFAALFAGNTQSMTSFWRTLGDGKHGFTPAEASSIERTLSVGAFVKNHVPLLQLVLSRLDSSKPTSLSDLARLQLTDWEGMVKQVGAPPSIDPAGSVDPNDVFARVVYARVTRAFPTAALSSRVLTGNLVPKAEQGPLNQFFINNADVNLIRHNLAAWVADRGENAFAGIAVADRPAVIANAKRMQRVLFVAPDVDTAHTLLGLDLDSATRITMLGRQQFFVQATKAGLSKVQANRVYDTSSQRYAGLVTLYTQLNRDALGIWPKAIGDKSSIDGPTSKAVARDGSLSVLFGSQDYCEVDSCTSILSPAAYLCDLLYWLRGRMTGGTSALDTLNGRRADIGNLKLNCPNTETPLPYIDLVNEILSDAISVPLDPNSKTNPPWKQTSEDKTAADLRAAPEYFNSDAFVALFNASYPHALPYSEGLDELRAYVQQSGMGLWQLRKALLPLHAPPIAAQVAVAAERFTMPPRAVQLATTPNFVAAPVAWHTAAPATDLAPVTAFTHAAAITYDQLRELLQSAWVQGGLNITIIGIDDTCDASIQSLSPSPLDAGFLDRAHRFLRIWRATGYAMWELDLLLRSAAVVNNVLDPAGLLALGNFRLLQDDTRLAADAQLAWFQSMDVAEHLGPNNTTTSSLYERVFLNPAVVSLHPDPDLAAVASGGAIVDATLSNHLAAIQAALGMSGSDASALVALFALDAPNTLALDNLSLLYRITQLAHAARLSITDLQRVAAMINPGLAPAAALTAAFISVASASSWIQQIKAIKQSGFGIDTLGYLLVPPAAVAPLWASIALMTDTAIGAALGAVRTGILAPSGGDVNGSIIAAVAGQLGLANDLTAFAMQMLLLPGTARTLLAVLTDASISAPAGGPYPDTTRVNYGDQFVAIQLLDKVRIIAQNLHLVNADLTWLVTNAAAYGGLDFTALPVTPAQPALGVAPLLNTALVVKLARLFTAAAPAAPLQTLYDIIGAVNSGALGTESLTQAALSTITGWTVPDIAAFTAALGTVFPADYKLPSTYDGLRSLEAMIAATTGKASGAQVVLWSQTPADEATAETMAASALNVLKARYANPDWLSAAPAIMNPLREHRSAALQAYLVGNGDHTGRAFADVNALFDYFLIDTQMSSCEVSTRVIQAYIAVQIFVERCRMNLEAPAVVVNANDDAWGWWSWMKRYRIWEAAREVFLFPENWLVETQRPSRTEIYKKLEQDVHQNDYTSDNFETVTLNYLDGLENIAHLQVTGTCLDPHTGTIYVVARVHSDAPKYYYRSLVDSAWTSWIHIPLDIKAHHVVPAVYGGRLVLFWPEVKVQNEPHQNLPPAQASNNPPSQESSKYVSINLHSSVYRNNAWAPAQATRGKLFDVPMLSSSEVSNSVAVEAVYTVKVQPVAGSGGYGGSLNVDVFRLGAYDASAYTAALQAESDDYARAASDIAMVEALGPVVFGPSIAAVEAAYEAAAAAAIAQAGSAAVAAANALQGAAAVHIGRAVYDGRFSELEQRNLSVIVAATVTPLLTHAHSTYGPDSLPLIPLAETDADPNLQGEPNLVPRAGALMTNPRGPTDPATLPLAFTSVPLEIPAGSMTLLNTAAVPFRVIGPDSSLAFDPTSYFFYQDNRRCYYVETQRWYWSGSTWSPNVPSNPGNVPFETRYVFHRFYHPYARLLWHQLSSSGIPGIYNSDLQQAPDQVDPSHADVFSFQDTYHPVVPGVAWGEDNEILDFEADAAYSVYNWELFFHNPLYIAGLLSQNQQFEDATKWFHYIFDPTRQGTDPAPQRFWIPKPLHDLTSAAILAERINNLLVLVNQGDPTALGQVKKWRDDPFNPYLLADLRPVAYMKNVVMAYLDNLIAWADNLFATDSREALSEATLLYVIAAEILGPQPQVVTPPTHADDSYNELAPKLDVFANAMVDIENVMGSGGGGMGGGGVVPAPQTFYFKIPPNDKLLGYWSTVADRLFKLRHCQNIQGVTRELALFDAPIDPGLLVKASAAGVDLGSVLKDLAAPLPNYRYTFLYTQALDFVNAVRAYGTSLLGAIEKSDGAALAVLQQTIAQQIQHDMDTIFDAQVSKAQSDIDALNEALALSAQKFAFSKDESKSLYNAAEFIGMSLKAIAAVIKTIAVAQHTTSTVVYLLPAGSVGVTGAGGSPTGVFTEGGKNVGDSSKAAGFTATTLADLLDAAGTVATTVGTWQHRQDGFEEAAKEASYQIAQTQAQIASAEILLAIAQQNQTNHEKQIDYIQKQIDFLTDKFTDQELYDWQVGVLADTYFQSYNLAYRMCKQVERCYQYELGIDDSDFIQFGYWDSLRKGLLAGETLNHDLRRMQASYLDENKRRFEMSRFVSLAAIDPVALQQLLLTGACDFDLPESLFDNDYPGHYNRHVVRMSVTVVYPSPGKFDNVKATLTLTANKVRNSTTAASSADYTEVGPADPRFVYNYAAVSQKIVFGNAQDDPGLFLTAIASNISDTRYLPFEGAGAVSSWHFELPESTNDIDLTGVSDIMLHMFYTAQDGGDALKAIVQQNNLDNAPTAGIKVFNARNDFGAPAPTVAVPYPLSPWDAFTAKPAAADPDQSLVLSISPSKFPIWTRGKTITITGITLLAVGWSPGNYTLEPQAPLTQALADMNMTPVAGSTEPNICGATLVVPPNTPPGKWTFKLKLPAAADFRSITKNDIGDVLLILNFSV